MLRTLDGLDYQLTYKNIKHVNMRVTKQGGVAVSAPFYVDVLKVDAFVLSKKAWIENALCVVTNPSPAPPAFPFTDAQCLSLFERISDDLYPHFATLLNEKPVLKVRAMKSSWGVCHVRHRIITLNSALMLKPILAIEYVILHEYVHFLHPNHQKGFHDTMRQMMPDYKQRRLLLR